jgi:hypothetical protein
VRSPCEKPPVRRSAIAPHVEQLDQLVRALAARAADAVQLAEVLDVLAAREPRIQAEAVGQHAEPRLRALRRLDRVDRRRPRCCRHRAHHRIEHAQRRRLAGTVRSEQAR